MLQKLKHKLLISLAIGGGVYLFFIIYANFNQFLHSLSQFSLWLLPVILLLSFANFAIRFYKWNYYLSLIKVKINKLDSFYIFMSGLVMSVTPGKVGEFLKAYLIKERTNVPMSKTSPVIIVERLTDSIAFILISLVGAYIFNYGMVITLIITFVLILFIIVLTSPKLFLITLHLLEKSSRLNKHIIKIEDAYKSMQVLLKPSVLFGMTIVSVIAWLAECLGYYLILRNFGIEINFMWASFSYAFANIVGTVSMLPGGLGVTEGSLTFLLLGKGVSKTTAVTTTFIARVATLWFAVLVGVIALSLLHHRKNDCCTEDNIE
ncbi:MAG TPA: flippase-like domain-containing protein [Ignavibacteria bacterium]|nr:flippase-like domain-containing protein [Ignavibacteria bacterium]